MFKPSISEQDNISRLNKGLISHSDFYFARYLAASSNTSDPELFKLFADLSHALTEQHSCLNLGDYPNTEYLIEALKKTNCVRDIANEDPKIDVTPTP